MKLENAIAVLGSVAAAAVLLMLVTCTGAPGPSPAGSPPSTTPPPPEEPADGFVDDMTGGADVQDVDDFDNPDDFDDDMVMTDDEIHEAVHEALERATDVEASTISVRVEDGEVFLSGTVRSEREHDRAHTIAHAVEGVRAVFHEELVVR